MIKIRVAAIIRVYDKVLMHRAPGDDFWTLPGGNIEILESSDAAIRREIREEIGLELGVIDLSIIAEHRYQHQGKHCHEIGFYYTSELVLHADSDLSIVNNDIQGLEMEKGLIFRWIGLEELAAIALRPSFLLNALQSHQSEILHVMQDFESAI